MDVSVVIVTRNTCELLCAAIQSVLDGNALRSEIIVVDNGSTDGTRERVPQQFPQVKYQWSERNLGFAKANNVGARQATGEFLLLLNSDARVQPTSIANAVEWMREHRECGVAGVQLLNPDGSRQNSIANFPTLATELLNKSLLRRLFPERFPGKEKVMVAPLEVQSVIGAFLITPRALWEKLGGLDEDYFFYLEETDYCFRVKQNGCTVMHLPQVQVWHEQGKSANQVRPAARIEYWRSRYIYFRKHHASGTCVLLKIGLLVRLLANWLVNGLISLLSAGLARKVRLKFGISHALLGWHLRGCPERAGLPR